MEKELINDFAQYHLLTVGNAEATANKYKNFLERLVDWSTDNDKQLLELTRDDLVQFSSMHAHEQGLSARTRRPLIAAIRGFYKWLFKNQKINTNPAEDLIYPKAGRPLPFGMQLSSAEKLLKQPDLDTFQGLRDATILSLFIGGGLRPSFVSKLNESNLVFYLDEKKYKQLVVRITEKGNKERLVPMPLDASLFIQAYLGHPELQQVDRLLDNGEKVLFISTRNRTIPAHDYHGENRRIKVKAIREMIIKYGEAAGVPRRELSPKAARHLYGTELAEDGVNTLTIQALMGHADPKTSDIYAHVAARRLAQVVHKSSPLAKIETPMTPLIRKINND